MKLSTKGPLISTDAKTKRDDATVRQIRASALGESIYSYEQRLKDIGVEF